MARKQACRVAIITQSEQHQIKVAHALQCLGIPAGGMQRTQFPRYRMQLRGRNGNAIEPNLSRHARVSGWIVWRHATLVAEINVPCRPISLGGTQSVINPARRIATGEGKMELTTFMNRLR